MCLNEIKESIKEFDAIGDPKFAKDYHDFLNQEFVEYVSVRGPLELRKMALELMTLLEKA